MSKIRELGQYLTQAWVPELIVERHFGDLDASDLVLEPSVGAGAWLQAVPAHVPAIGVDIDHDMVTLARKNTGRRIIHGDFRTVDLDGIRPTLILGNPPFSLAVVDGFLARAFDLLPFGRGKVGLLLPAYTFQTANRVAAYADKWSISSEFIPRSIFPGLRLPLCFAIFSKDARRKLVGLALYREAADMASLRTDYRKIVESSGRSVWLEVVERALGQLGGEASLSAIYGEIEGNRPTRTQFWREQVRKVLRKHVNRFRPVDCGRYALRSPTVAGSVGSQPLLAI